MKTRCSHSRKLFCAWSITVIVLAVALATSNSSAFGPRDGGSRERNQPAPGAAGPSVVATVDGLPISANIFRMFVKNGIEALGLDSKSAQGRRHIDLLREGVIFELIDRALIEEEVNRRKLSVPDDELANTKKKAVADLGGEEKYRRYLSENGLTEEEYQKAATQEFYGRLLRAALAGEVTEVREDEIRAFFEKQRHNPSLAEMFEEPEQVRASHILLEARQSKIAAEIQSNGKLGPPELEQRIAAELNVRRALAEEVIRKVKAGGDFSRLAAEYSSDAGTKDRGGDLGLFTRGTHTARFDAAAFSLKAGETSGIVETDYGFHIIKVIEHRPARARSLAELTPAIRERLLSQKRAAYLKSWLEARRRSARIEIDPFYRTGSLQSFASKR